MISDHRELSNSNARTSGITEINGEREQLLDDLILEIDGDEEHRRPDGNEKSETDRTLLAAGVEICEKALRRRAKEKKNDGVVDLVGSLRLFVYLLIGSGGLGAKESIS